MHEIIVQVIQNATYTSNRQKGTLTNLYIAQQLRSFQGTIK